MVAAAKWGRVLDDPTLIHNVYNDETWSQDYDTYVHHIQSLLGYPLDQLIISEYPLALCKFLEYFGQKTH